MPDAQEHVLPFAQPHEDEPQQRSVLMVEGLASPRASSTRCNAWSCSSAGVARKIDRVDVDRRFVLHQLPRLVVDQRIGRAKDVVTPDQVTHASFERAEIDVTCQPVGAAFVVGDAARIEPSQEPHSSLRIRENGRTTLLSSWDSCPDPRTTRVAQPMFTIGRSRSEPLLSRAPFQRRWRPRQAADRGSIRRRTALSHRRAAGRHAASRHPAGRSRRSHPRSSAAARSTTGSPAPASSGDNDWVGVSSTESARAEAAGRSSPSSRESSDRRILPLSVRGSSSTK